jgi:hypothetical protein
VSPEVLDDGRVVFRIDAPGATRVFLNAGDLPPLTFTPPGATPVPQTPGSPGATLFAKRENGVWEFTTVSPVPPGAFRYAIMVDGVRTLDPVNTRTSESNTAMWSLFFVPGIGLEEVKDVPHGAVAGTAYRTDGATPYSGAVIRVTSGSGGAGTLLATLTSDASGNFYTSSSIAFGSGAYVIATGTGGVPGAMSAAVTGGACNRCHTSANRLVVD